MKYFRKRSRTYFRVHVGKKDKVLISSLREFLSLNVSHLDSIDISSMVIIAELAPCLYNLIDGQHRVKKA